MENLNWLFLILVLGILGIGFFYLPPFWIVINAGLALSLGILVFWNTMNADSATSGRKIEETRLKSIIDNLRDGVIAYDENYKILVFNPAAEEIFGMKASEIIGQSFTLKVKQATPGRYRVLLTILFPALAPMIIRRSEPGVYPQIMDMSFDEPPLELRVMTARITDAEGNVLGFLKIIHDRTRELTLLRAKSEFITIASHQLRTPLSGLNWALSNMKDEPLTPPQKDLIGGAVSAVKRLLKVVEDLLDVAKIEEGRFGYQFQETDIVQFLDSALRQAQPIAAQYKIKVYLEKPKSDLPKIQIDSEKLAMVVSNLLDNAIKYNIPNGEVVVRVEKPENTPYVQVSVKDTGIGIPAEVVNKLFTKFFRADNALKVAVEGTGLGLYIAKNIIRRHGGKIWAESTLNRGTTFYFTLPTNPTLIPAKEIIYEEE